MIESLIDSAPTSTYIETKLLKPTPSVTKSNGHCHLLVSELTLKFRERISGIANLVYRWNDSKTALRHYQNYVQINRDTFRDNLYMKLSHIIYLFYWHSMVW